MDTYYLQAVRNKLAIAQKLSDGQIGGTYYEAYLIVVSILSATASILWPGDRIDRKRFTQLLIKYNNSDTDFSKISIPLVSDAEILSPVQKSIFLKKYYNLFPTQIFTGEEIDINEQVLVEGCKDIPLQDIRKYSYASIFYESIRSNLVHEYSVSEKASISPMSDTDVFVSYTNYCEPPSRRICFHINPMLRIIDCIAQEVAESIEKAPFSTPTKWWIDGGE